MAPTVHVQPDFRSSEPLQDGQRAILGNIATRRLGRPEDIANGVLFFVAEEASWVTGQVISIDGGHSIF